MDNFPVSTTINPLIQTAELAVKRASIMGIKPDTFATEIMSRPVPTKMAAREL